MKKNVGIADKIVRIILAIVFAVLYFTNIVTGVWGYVLLVLAAILLLTSLFSFCPLWLVFGINTSKKEKADM